MPAKIHVTVREDLVGIRSVIDRVISVGRMRDVNLSRALEFGIVTGIVDDSGSIATLRGLPEVEAVEVDQRRHMMGTWNEFGLRSRFDPSRD